MIGNKTKKIVIIGLPGSGKSTFAHRLSKRTAIPVYHLDKYFYTSGWVEKDQNLILNIQKELVSRPEWIIDGNNIQSLEMRYSVADLIIYFKMPKYICIYRALKRIFFKDSAIDDRAEGCKETFKWWIIKYIFDFEKLTEAHLTEMSIKYSEVEVVEIVSNDGLRLLEEQLVMQSPLIF